MKPRRITVDAQSEEWRGPVAALNRRMASRGGWGFFENPVPAWLAATDGAKPCRRYYVAHEGGAARGGYVLKHERAMIAGELRDLASIQGPFIASPLEAG